MNPLIDLLRQSIDLPAGLQERINEATQTVCFRRGDRITLLSEIRENIFYIIKGCARLYYTLDEREHTFSFAIENEVLLISKILISTPDVMVTVEFLEPTVALMIAHSSVREAFMSMSDHTLTASLTALWSAALLNYCKYLEERVLILQNTSAISRYRWMQNRYPTILERATMTQVASFLGITRETIYRIRSGKYSPKQ